jgi:hypothetical protein
VGEGGGSRGGLYYPREGTRGKELGAHQVFMSWATPNVPVPRVRGGEEREGNIEGRREKAGRGPEFIPDSRAWLIK